MAENYGKKVIKEAINKATAGAKKFMIKTVAPVFIVILILMGLIVVIAGSISGEDLSISSSTSDYNIVTGASRSLSLTTTMFDKETFIEALQAYYDSSKNENFKINFLDKVDELYDASIANNVNPEVVVITAKCEGNFSEAGGSYNYWGIGVYNGSNVGASYSSFEEGIKGYAEVLASYQTGGSREAQVMERYEERKDTGCSPLGYGLPGTFSGMQSLYSDLGMHEEGSSGTGGYYYMDPERSGVTQIYSTHQEFLDKCYNVGGEHAEGQPCTHYERGQYTAWQVGKKYEVWNAIFGAYGSIGGTGGTATYDVNTVTTGGYTFPLYIQENISGNYRSINYCRSWVWSFKFSYFISRFK